MRICLDDGTLGQAGDPGWEQCWAKMMNLVSNPADSEGGGGPKGAISNFACGVRVRPLRKTALFFHGMAGVMS